ncbi:hypothetical protein [Nannocystis pusilla]|uniref:hypothetical protein n=1 Tax=Nannocystis pusilla TaxID=889268 RepID=UPI003B7CF470
MFQLVTNTRFAVLQRANGSVGTICAAVDQNTSRPIRPTTPSPVSTPPAISSPRPVFARVGRAGAIVGAGTTAPVVAGSAGVVAGAAAASVPSTAVGDAGSVPSSARTSPTKRARRRGGATTRS